MVSSVDKKSTKKEKGMGLKFKHWAYNYVKTAQSNYHARLIVKLNEQGYFRKGENR